MNSGAEVLRERSLVLVVAGPGYGKSTAVRSWLAGEPVQWYAGHLPTVTEEPPGAGWLVVDDLVASDEPAGSQLSSWLHGLPVELRVVLLLRQPPAGRPRRGAGPTGVIGPRDLALPVAAVADELGGGRSRAVIERVHELTAGWPALVKLAGQQLGPGSPPVERVPELLTAAGGPLARYIRNELLDPLPAAAMRVLRDAAELEFVCADLLGDDAGSALDTLAATGLVLPAGLPDGTYRFDPTAPAGPWWRPVPLIAALLRGSQPAPDADCRRRWLAAAHWCRDHRLPGLAARLYLAAGDAEASAGMLRRHGEQVVAAGGAALLVAIVDRLPQAMRDQQLRLIHSEALAVVGDYDAALAELTPLAAPSGPVDPAIAWRAGAVHYHRAERDAALAALARGRLDTLRTRDEAFLLAHTATVHWSLGAAEPCRQHAEQALQVAEAAADPRALAAARVALALHAMLVADRNGNAAHYEAAIRHAERGRDAVQLARIHANRVSILLEESRFEAAHEAGVLAVAAADAAGQAAILALALVNHAEALTRLGRLAEAEQCLQRAVAINQRAGSRKVAYPLAALGDVHAYRGAWGLARAAYEEAVRVADTDGFVQCLVPALAGLAVVVANEDQVAGDRLAQRAVALANGPLRTRALLAAGRVALAAAATAATATTATTAATAAGAAADSARRHRDRAGLAEALELQAIADPPPAGAAELLREAARTWHGTGARLDADRVAVRLAWLPDATAAERLAGKLAMTRLSEAGVMPPPAQATPEVRVRTLGPFEVEVRGRVVPGSAWQSRKARDLLRILVARRGRMVGREELSALLWHDGDSHRLAHRLSVALSTLRSVLDPDRQVPADHYVVSSSGGVRVDLAHVKVDIESLFEEAAFGLRLHQQGLLSDAYHVLGAAAAGYLGDFYEDEPYQDWSEPTREEARAAYLRVLRALAAVSRELGRVDEAVAHLLRILHHDPFDEAGHGDLVSLLRQAGRHGEARRAHGRYLAAMRDLGVSPNPALAGRPPAS